MFCRSETGLKTTQGDVCLDCQKWPERCLLAALLKEALDAGMHLNVIFCPEFRPDLGR